MTTNFRVRQNMFNKQIRTDHSSMVLHLRCGSVSNICPHFDCRVRLLCCRLKLFVAHITTLLNFSRNKLMLFVANLKASKSASIPSTIIALLQVNTQ